MEVDDDLGRLLDIKRASEKQVFNLYAHAKFWAWVFGLLAAGMFTMAGWVINIQRNVSDNRKWIDKRDAENLPQRMHDAEENGKRRDNQIRTVWRKMYGEDPY